MFVDSVCKLRDHSFLISGGCSLVGEFALEDCEGFLVGGTSACPLVDGAGWVLALWWARPSLFMYLEVVVGSASL